MLCTLPPPTARTKNAVPVSAENGVVALTRSPRQDNRGQLRVVSSEKKSRPFNCWYQARNKMMLSEAPIADI